MSLFATLQAALACVALASAKPFQAPTADSQNKITVASPSTRPPSFENYRFEPPVNMFGGGSGSGGGSDDFPVDVRLLDLMLCASVDGKFHALDRMSGRKLWSMESTPPSDNATLFQPLVRNIKQATPRVLSLDAGDDDDEFHTPLEKYVIEPQSGDIYMIPDPGSPDDQLQKLPYTMAQLVDMSPFSLPGTERVFIGRKETSLLSLDLHTGRLSASFGFAEESCKWDPWYEADDATTDLEEYSGRRIRPSPPQSVYIGRTDYHVAVHDKGHRLLQTLAFSTYGPNNADRDTQDRWSVTPDKRYLQPMPDGQVLCFEVGQERPVWAAVFPKAIVAVFDIVMPAHATQPIILLQPVPKLIDVFPERYSQLTNLPAKAYVDVVDDALYAMSLDNYPLVTFSTVPPRREDEAEDGPARLTGVYYSNVVTESRLNRLLSGPKRLTIDEAHGPLLIDAKAANNNPPLLDSRPITALPSSKSSYVSVPNLIKQHRLIADVDSTHNANAIAAAICIVLLCAWLTTRKPGFSRWFARREVRSDLLAMDVVDRDRDRDKVKREGTVLREMQVEVPAKAERKEKTDVPPELPAKVEEPESPQPLVTSPQLSPSAELGFAIDGDAADQDAETDEDKPSAENGVSAGKKRVKRRNRGRGRKGKGPKDGDVPELQGAELAVSQVTGGAGDVVVVDAPGPSLGGMSPELEDVPVLQVSPPALGGHLPPSLLMLSDVILGYGSHGTIVYQGSLQGRPVAVKRLLQDFVTVASREVTLLQESDDHPNVIRYFYQEQRNGFLYIALELCPASLADIVEKPDTFPEVRSAFEPKRALMQITRGLRHLHSLKIVHRDIKPPNILISQNKKGALRMLISDFGLCKKLEMDQTSFLPTHGSGPQAAGTAGWRAPEILRGEVKLDIQSTDSSFGGKQDGADSKESTSAARLTKSVDIFALGCLFYYTLSSGEHPFGDRFEREANILKNNKTLRWLDSLGEEGVEAEDLIGRMLDPDPQLRPNTDDCLIHPFFWTPARRLAFLQDASDRFEVMERDPKEAPLIALETGASGILGPDWHKRLDKVFIENLGKFRKYNGSSVQDLLRALRNKKHHYQDLPEHVKRHLGPLPDGFLGYFTRRFPQLFLHVHGVISGCGLRHEPMFRTYFDHSEM